MPTKYRRSQKVEALSDYLLGLSLAAVSRKWGISQRTLEGWSAEENWSAIKRQQKAKLQGKVVSLVEASTAKSYCPAEPPPKIDFDNPEASTKVLQDAIATLSLRLQNPYDSRLSISYYGGNLSLLRTSSTSDVERD